MRSTVLGCVVCAAWIAGPAWLAELNAAEVLPRGAKLRLGSPQWRTVTNHAVAISPDGKQLVQRAGIHTVRIIDPLTGKELQALEVTEPEIGKEYSFSPDSKRLVLRNGDKISQIDLATGQKLNTIKAAPASAVSGPLMSYEVGGTGNVVASFEPFASRKQVMLWKFLEGKRIGVLGPAQNGGDLALSFSGNGTVLATSASRHDKLKPDEPAEEQYVEVWNTLTKKRIARLHAGATVYNIELSRDGKFIALDIAAQKNLVLWDIAEQKPIAETSLQNLRGRKFMRLSPDGKRLAIVTQEGHAAVWDIASGRLVPAQPVKIDWFGGIGFLENGNILACGTEGLAVRVWSISGAEPVAQEPVGHTDTVCLVKFTPDGKQLLTAGIDQRVIRWDAVTGKLLETLVDTSSDPYSANYWRRGQVAFSPDAKVFVVADSQGLHVHDLERKAELPLLKAAAGSIYEWHRVTFSADGKKVFAIGDGQKRGPDGFLVSNPYVAAWETATGNLLAEHTQPGRRDENVREAAEKLFSAQFGKEVASSTNPKLPEIVTGNLIRDPLSVAWNAAAQYLSLDVKVKDPNGGPSLLEARLDCPEARSIALSPDGQRLAVAWNDTTVLVFDLPTRGK